MFLSKGASFFKIICVHVCVCVGPCTHASTITYRVQKRVPGSLELESQAVGSPSVDAGNQTEITMHF